MSDNPKLDSERLVQALIETFAYHPFWDTSPLARFARELDAERGGQFAKKMQEAEAKALAERHHSWWHKMFGGQC